MLAICPSLIKQKCTKEPKKVWIRHFIYIELFQTLLHIYIFSLGNNNHCDDDSKMDSVENKNSNATPENYLFPCP